MFRQDHELTKSTTPIDLKKLAKSESFITFGGAFPDEMSGMDHDLSRMLANNSRISATNMPMAASLTRASGVISIVDPFSAELAEKVGGVVQRPLQQNLSYKIAIITRGLDTLPKEGKELADILAERFNSLPPSG